MNHLRAFLVIVLVPAILLGIAGNVLGDKTAAPPAGALSGTLTVSNSTFSLNNPDGINNSGILHLTNTIIANSRRLYYLHTPTITSTGAACSCVGYSWDILSYPPQNIQFVNAFWR